MSLPVMVTVGTWKVGTRPTFNRIYLEHGEMPEWEGRELTGEEAEMLGRVLIQAAAMVRRENR